MHLDLSSNVLHGASKLGSGMPHTADRSRQLLKRLHGVMGSNAPAQERLDNLVAEIATTMEVGVCSVYLVRADSDLELFSTIGLNYEAVHQSRLKIGQGLVGYIAERGIPLNLAEARKHPNFVYLPETGEEDFRSLAGVPIIFRENIAGVLVVQTRKARIFKTEEIETLQTIAMVVAEIVGAGDLIDPSEAMISHHDPDAQIKLVGQLFSPGLACGEVVFHEPRIEIERHVAENRAEERKRLEDGLDQLQRHIDDMLNMRALNDVGEHREILETYRMFALDKGWQHKLFQGIDEGLTAEASVEKVQQDIRMRMSAISDAYLRERLSDLDDLSNRLLRMLVLGEKHAEHHVLLRPSVVFAKSMGPAELLDYGTTFLKAIVLEEGSPTTHLSIIAKALEIPVLGAVRGATSYMDEGEDVIVDADNQQLFIRPLDDVYMAYQASIEEREAMQARYAADKDLPSVSRDGQQIDLYMNAGLMIDMNNLEKSGAVGVGLFRTEFQFMVSSTLPKMDAQVDLYTNVLEAAKGKPIIFRTLDIGSDKRVPFLDHVDEENPAMGWRATRLTMERPVLMRLQIRALLTAGVGQELNILFPMIVDVPEYRAVKAMVDEEVEHFKSQAKELPTKINIGTMLEVPALAWQLDELLPEIDFLSIGTNDLMQFFFAVDRSNPKLSNRYDFLSPSILRYLQRVIKKCDAAGVPISSCGEIGSNPIEAMALVGLGLKRISLSPTAFGPVKQMIRTLNVKKFSQWFEGQIKTSDSSLRAQMIDFAIKNDISI